MTPIGEEHCGEEVLTNGGGSLLIQYNVPPTDPGTAPVSKLYNYNISAWNRSHTPQMSHAQSTAHMTLVTPNG